MDKVAVFYNQNYVDQAKQYPRQKKRLFELFRRLVEDGDKAVSMHALNFQLENGEQMVDHVAGQLVLQMRDLTNSKIVAFFGDGGTGLFLAGMDQLGREVDPAVRENPVCLGPGGTYIHGAKAMGTAQLDEVVNFAQDDLDYRSQTVKIRNACVTKTDAETGLTISQKNHPFYGFAGMFFESYILMLNETMGRTGGRVKNALGIVGEAARDIFGGEAKRFSRLRAFTTMPRWGFARFTPEVESLDEGQIYQMSSDDAGPLDMLKISAVVNTISSNRQLLQAVLAGVDLWKSAGLELSRLGVHDILDKFRPLRIERFVEKFDANLLGGLNYSTDGFPHLVKLEPGEEAKLEIDTVAGSGVTVVRKN